MNKKGFGGLLQYGFFMLVGLLTVLYITAYSKGYMPFDEDEGTYKPDSNVSTPIVAPDAESSAEEAPMTATEFLASMQSYRNGDVIDTGIYDGSQLIVRHSTSTLGDLGGARLSVTMGCVYKYGADGTVSVYDKELNDVTAAVNGCELSLVRDAEGRPLFYNAGYCYLEDGQMVSASYDAVNFDKGVDGYRYPSYLAGGSSEYTVFGSGSGYGVKRNSDGKIIVDAKYTDVYAPSEGYIVAVGKAGGLYLFDTDGRLITDEYTVPAVQDGEDNMIGYFFVKDGFTRACKNGKEVVINTSGAVLPLPSDFTVLAYSDGVFLMKGAEGSYGFYGSDGKWLGAPYYENARPFYEGLAVVCRDGLYGMIDTDGNTVIPCVFDSLSDCQDGVIVAFTGKNGYCVFNKTAIQ